MIPVLVTGGAGYIGSHVCKYLAQHGYLPITVDNLSRGHADAVKWGPLERVDIRDRVFLGEVFVKYRPVAVVHLAGLAYVGESMEKPAEYYDANVVGTLNLLNEMRAACVRNLVFSSSCAVYGKASDTAIDESQTHSPCSPYGHSKSMCERIIFDYLRAYKMFSVYLRYFNASGADPDNEIGERHNPETHLIPLVLEAADGGRKLTINGQNRITEDGTCVRDYVHVWDLAQAHHLALKHLLDDGDSNDFNLGNGVGYSILDVINTAEGVTGSLVNYEFGERRPGDPAIAISNSTKAKDVLGWEPKYSDLETILATAWNWRNKK